jgi:hypothetical protein
MQSNAASPVSTENEAKPRGATIVDLTPRLPNAPAMVHVRFRPDATVWQIGELPAGLDNQKWYERLCAHAGDKYEARAGGRGFFRLTRGELDALRAPLFN